MAAMARPALLTVLAAAGALLVPTAPLLAQVSSQTSLQGARVLPEQLQIKEPLDPRQNQKIERIRREHDGTIVEELRVGGQTERIEVQPKGDLPAYEIDAAPLSRNRPADHRDGMSASGGRRSWNLLRF